MKNIWYKKSLKCGIFLMLVFVVFAVAVSTNVNAQEPDFAIATFPSSQTLSPGMSATFLVTVTSLNGFNSPVTLSATGLPENATASFAPNTVIPTNNSMLTISTSPDAPTGNFNITVMGTGDGLTRSTSAAITINFGLVPKQFGTFAGQVTDMETGNPIEGATVFVYYRHYYSIRPDYRSWGKDIEVTTDSNGYYTITDVPLNTNNAPKDWVVGFHADNYSGTYHLATAIANTITTVDMALCHASITGRVIDATTGEPIAGAEIRAMSIIAYSQVQAYYFTTDDQGFYTLANLPLGADNEPRYYNWVTAEHYDYYEQFNSFTISCGSNITLNLSMVPKLFGTFTGQVTDMETGNPIGGATVFVYSRHNYYIGLPYPWSRGWSKDIEVTTDSNGYYTITDVPLNVPYNNAPKDWVVGFHADNYSGTYHLATAIANTITTVDMALCHASITGRVINATTGEPIPEASIYAWSDVYYSGYSSWVRTYSLTTDEQGFYTLANLPLGADNEPRTYYVQASDPGYWDQTNSSTISCGDNISLNLSMAPKLFGTYAGQVTDMETGNPIEGATVFVYSYYYYRLYTNYRSWYKIIEVTTDSNGYYTITDVPLNTNNAPKDWVVGFHADNYSSTYHLATAIANTITTVDMALCHASITGRVIDATTGEPIAEAEIRTWSDVYYSNYSSTVDTYYYFTTDEQGFYTLANLPLGADNEPRTYYVRASAPGYWDQTKSGTIFCGGIIIIDFAGEVAFGTITGTVTDCVTELPIEGAFIGSTFGGSAYTDGEGMYTLTDVPLEPDGSPRTWNVTARADGYGYGDQTKSVEVRADEVSILNFTLCFPIPPIADANGPYEDYEGSPITFDASASYDPDGDSLRYRWDFDNDGTWDTSYSTDPTVTHTWGDDYSGTVVVEVYDGIYKDTDTANVTVNNVAPQFPLIGLGIAHNYILVTNTDAQSYIIDILGDGSLGSPESIDDKDSGCYGAGIGDFDNDGDLDALVGDSSNTWYYEKTGDGNNFASAVSIDSTYHYYRCDFAEADYNNDGNLDAIMAGYGSNYYTLYTGNGDGTFTVSTLSGPNYNIIGMDAGDFNGDGNIDFIAAQYGYYGAYIYLGNGDGTFKPEIFVNTDYDNSWGVCAGDFDNDGDDDFIFGMYQVKFYPGNGDGTFGTPVDLGFYANALAESDINGDGNLDIVYTDYSNYMQYRTGNGDGTFSLESSTYVAGSIYGIATTSGGWAPLEVYEGDMTMFTGFFSDPGWLDTHTATWDWGDGSPTEVGTVIEENNEPMATGKVTGSHCYGDNGEYTITLTVTDDDGASSTSSCIITVKNVAPNATILGGIVIADNYILVTNYDAQSYFIDILDDGSLGSPESIDDKDYGCYGAGIGDFDNDGDFDALVGDSSDTWYYEKIGDGNSFAAAVSIDSTYHTYRMDFAEADYNDDGNLDAIMADYSSNYYTIYTGNGDGTFTISTLSGPSSIIGMDSADFNEDGNMDFIASSLDYGAYIYLGNGDGTFFQPPIFLELGYEYSWSVCAGDFDNDGNDDFIFGNNPHFYPGNGDGTFGSPVSLGFSSYALAESDIDGDGNLDIVYTYGSNMHYRTGNGDGTFSFVSSTSVTSSLYGIATSLEYGDVLLVNEGDMTPFTGTFSDPGWLDTHTAIWDWGDGSSTESGTVTEENDEPFATGEVTGSHVYDAIGEYTITLTVTDDDGGVGNDTATVNVVDVQPPVADAGGPYIEDEGSAIVFDASGSSSNIPIPLQYRWDFDNDGTWDTSYSTNPTATHTWADDYTGTVKVEVYNGWYTDTDTANVTVNNVAPEASILGGIAVADNYILITDYYGTSYFIDILGGDSFCSPEVIDYKTYYCYGAGIGDFDNDGDFDALVGDSYNTWYYEKTGDGNSFAPAVSIDSTYHQYRMDFAEADYNNDGNLDAIMADYSSNYYTIYTGNGDGTFTISTLSGPSSIIGMDSADFNEDGNMDFIASSLDYGAYIYLGNGDGTFFQPPIFLELGYEYSWSVCAGDFDNDGDDDFIFGQYSAIFYPGNGDGTFGTGTSSGIYYPTAIAESDIDADGNLDIVYTDGDNMIYYTGNGDGTFTYRSQIPVSSILYGIAIPPELLETEIYEGDTIPFTGTFSDPGWDDVHTAIWDWGDDNTESGTVTEENEEPFATGEVTGDHCYGDNGEYTITLTVTDDDGGVGNDTMTIKILNVPPVAEAGANQTVDEGDIVYFDGSGTYDPGFLDELNYTWDFGDGSSPVSGVDLWNPTHVYGDNGVYTVTLTVEDDDGETDTDTMTVTVNNVAPTADAGDDKVGDEPSTFTFTGSHTDPGFLDTHTYEWDFDYDGTTFDVDATGNDVSNTWCDDFNGDVALRVTDDDGGWDIDTCSVVVSNVAPDITTLTVTPSVVEVDDTVTLDANFTDPGCDTWTAYIDWDNDGTYDETISSVTNPISATHSYTDTGVYTVKLKVEDDDLGYDTEIFQYVVVYDPNDGFVTGGGWIDSPAGAYTPDPTLTGKATFGFVSKYQKGKQNPMGNTEFQFHAAGMNFHSNEYDWLVITHHKAMYKGNGTINGDGNYGFMLSAIDEKLTPSTDVDLFRIKIWDKDNNDEVIYDNQLGDPEDGDPTTAIDSGQIVIHKA